MKYTYGPASLWVGGTDAVPAVMRDRVREVSAVHVEPEHRRQGFGSAIMQAVCADADHAGFVLLLQPEPESGGMTIDELSAWYSRFGFVAIQESPLLMARSPRPLAPVVH